MTIDLDFGRNRLLAVPSVHYRAAFAEEANLAFLRIGRRPKAVAVELGAATTSAIALWMRELLQAPGSSLPCMVGLVDRNRLIHPAFTERVVELEESWGCRVEDLPPHILQEHLHFRALSLTCLSATDSIIESIRSAIEHDIPVYGIDLDGFANHDRLDAAIQDPSDAHNNLERYVDHNAGLASLSRDDWVDGRRETFMTARLKYLLEKHETVLFTGGLAHWRRIQAQLHDSSIVPVRPDSEPDISGKLRVLVDPAIAIHQMDLLPELTAHFEMVRQMPPGIVYRAFPYRNIFQTKLGQACKNARPEDRQHLGAFTQYLTNLCLTSQRSIPDLFTTVRAARAVVDQGFADRLAKELVSDSIEWANSKLLGDLPYIRSSPLTPEESGGSSVATKAEIVSESESIGPAFVSGRATDQKRRFKAYLPVPEAQSDSEYIPDPTGNNILYGGAKRRRKSPNPRDDGKYVLWAPDEILLYATAYQATKMAFERASRTKSEPFAGSLGLGLDTKATLRSYARADRRIHVKVKSSATAMNTEDGLLEPVVMLFEEHAAAKNADWSPYVGGWRSEIEPRIRDGGRFKRVVETQGDHFIVLVLFQELCTPKPELRELVQSEVNIWGSVSFGQVCQNSLQAARWLESSDYSRSPIAHGRRFEDLEELYRSAHQIELDRNEWQNTLIRIAIPYAIERVVVVAQKGFRVSADVQSDARAHNKAISVIPSTNFPAERILAARTQRLIFGSGDDDDEEYEQQVEAALGQRRSDNFDLLPPSIARRLATTN